MQDIDWKELDFGDCDMPSIEYRLKDAKYRFAGLGPISLEAPFCPMETTFGPPEKEQVLQVFDGQSYSTFRDSHDKLLQKILAAILDFRRAIQSTRGMHVDGQTDASYT